MLVTISENVIDVGGLPVHYWEGGAANGRALLLLHGGFGEAWANWQKVMPTLAEEFHVFAPDLPGFGGSALLPEMTFPALITWLRALLDTLGQSEAVIVGNFLGGLLARLFATAAPTYVPAVILVNGGTIPKLPPILPKLVGLPLLGNLMLEVIGRASGSRRRIDQMVFVKEALDEELLRTWHDNTSGFIALIRAMIRHDYPHEQNPPLPVLLLWGANDPLLTVKDAEALHADLPGSRLEIVANCGSLPQLEVPDVFLFQVSSFLDRLTHRSAPVLPGVGMLRPR